MTIALASTATLVILVSHQCESRTSQRQSKLLTPTSSLLGSPASSNLSKTLDDEDSKYFHTSKHAEKTKNTHEDQTISSNTIQDDADHLSPKNSISKDSANATKGKYVMPILTKSISKSAAMVLAPSLESIAMRIVSSAASKTVGRSSFSTQSSSSSNPNRNRHTSYSHSTPSDTAPSFLSSLSSTLFSTAMSQLIGYNTSSSSVNGMSQSPTNSWQNKLAPLFYSLATLSGFNPDPSETTALASPSSSSFLSTDLATSSSSSQPTIYAPVKPHNPKQNSPTVTGLVNLARYVLCKYNLLQQIC